MRKRKYEFCNCWHVRPVKGACTDIMDEIKEVMEVKNFHDFRDEMSDVMWGVNRLLAAFFGKKYVRIIPFDKMHYEKVSERMAEYGCIRSYKKRCSK